MSTKSEHKLMFLSCVASSAFFIWLETILMTMTHNHIYVTDPVMTSEISTHVFRAKVYGVDS